ncbi:MAG: MotA/TolQ/ExbB proton channel family protein [Gemmatimonadetes bacterium]|nr:MotA/TolQ/ExbB proton channel family protein [Gemmatimonadota bacterium]
MFDLFSESEQFLEIRLLVSEQFLEIWLSGMAFVFLIWGCWPLFKTWHKIRSSRKALGDLRSWGEKYPQFTASKYHSRKADEISDPSLNPTIQKWLKLFWAGHRQNKPPVVEDVLQREEEVLCSNDETIRTTSGSLIILGLLGTFIGLLSVIQPIQDIIGNTKNSTTIAGQPGIVLAEMLENIAQSLSGMEFAFGTSIAGLVLMIVLNFFLAYLNGKRTKLIDELEIYCNEEIAPKFRLFLPEVDFEDAINDAFRLLAERHTEFIEGQEDYLKNALEGHFTKVSALLESFLQELGDVSDTLKEAMVVNEKVSQRWDETLDSFSHRHSEFIAGQEDYLKSALGAHFEKMAVSLEPLLQTLDNASDTLNKASTNYWQVSGRWDKTLATFSKGAEDVRKSGEGFVKHISNFTKLSEPLEALKTATEKMVKDFDERIRALALTMGETYQVLQKLNPDESMYSPVFENVKAQLRAIHATEQDLLAFHQSSSVENKADLDEKVGIMLQSLASVESLVECLNKTIVANLATINQTMNDFSESLRQQKRIISSLDRIDEALRTQNADDKPRNSDGWLKWLKRFIGREKN